MGGMLPELDDEVDEDDELLLAEELEDELEALLDVEELPPPYTVNWVNVMAEFILVLLAQKPKSADWFAGIFSL